MNNELMDKKTAYAAMYEFLVDYYERTKSDDIGVLLGSMSLLGDGSPADPAIWSDWMKSVVKAKEQKHNLFLGLKS